MVMAVVTAHILSPSSELEKLLRVKILVLSLLLFSHVFNGIQWNSMVFNGLRWSRIISDGLGWSRIVSDGLRWS